MKDAHSFVFEALSKELFVGNVYLRVYNDQPDFEISEPEVFCVALIDFISLLLHKQWNCDPVVQSSGLSPETSELHTDTLNGSLSENPTSDGSSVQSGGEVVDKEEVELVKNLQFGLTSLQVIIGFLYGFSFVFSTRLCLYALGWRVAFGDKVFNVFSFSTCLQAIPI